MTLDELEKLANAAAPGPWGDELLVGKCEPLGKV